MSTPPNSRSPDRPRSDLRAALAAFDHLAALGLVSELVVHVLFAHRGWCRCPRCLFDLDRSAVSR